MRNVLIFLFYFSVASVSAQETFYPRRIDSEKWLKQLKEITNKDERIDYITAKIYADTIYKNLANQIFMDNKIRDPEKHICRTIIVVKFANQYFKIDLVENPKLENIVKLFNSKRIDEITFLSEVESVANFGSDGLCGVVILNTKDKKFARKLRNVL